MSIRPMISHGDQPRLGEVIALVHQLDLVAAWTARANRTEGVMILGFVVVHGWRLHHEWELEGDSIAELFKLHVQRLDCLALLIDEVFKAQLLATIVLFVALHLQA